MKKTLIILTASLLILSGCSQPTPDQTATLTQQINSLQKQVTDLQQNNTRLESQVKNLEQQLSDAEAQAAAENTTESRTFENTFMKVTIPAGWSYNEATRTVTGANSEVTTEKSGAINVTKGNYILFINPNTTQASGVEGGRFSEIGQGAPGVDLVQKFNPAGPCGTSVANVITSQLDRNDLYISKSGKQVIDSDIICDAPTNGKTLWYFSYVTNTKGGYFGIPSKINSSITDPQREFVITMTYKAQDINSLPQKDSSDLKQLLDEMTEIVKTVEFK